MRAHWNRLPVILRIQLLGVLAVCLAPAIVVNGRVDDRAERIAFAVPAPHDPREPWDREVDAFALKVSQAFGVQRSTASQFAGWILEASERHDIAPDLLASLVHTESTFRTHARSPVGAVGPAQVRPQFWSNFCGTTNLLDPAENIYCGAQVLSFLRDECGGEQCALQAYNVGDIRGRHGAARRYVAKIDRALDRLRRTEL